MEMKDVKIVTVVLGTEGGLFAKFNPDNGELVLWPNVTADKADEGAKEYKLLGSATRWSIMSMPEE